jgi:hypothetical protein
MSPMRTKDIILVIAAVVVLTLVALLFQALLG